MVQMILSKVDDSDINQNGIFVVHESVTEIGKDAFSGCKKIRQIVLPSGLNSIGAGAFRDCENLEKINIPEGVVAICPSAFDGCTKINQIQASEICVNQLLYSLCGHGRNIILIKLLLEHGADVDYIDPKSQRKPIHVATENNKIDVVRLLLENGADVNSILNSSPSTLLRLDIEEEERIDVTPLVIAIYSANISMVKFLIEEAGANTEVLIKSNGFLVGGYMDGNLADYLENITGLYRDTPYGREMTRIARGEVQRQKP